MLQNEQLLPLKYFVSDFTNLALQLLTTEKGKTAMNEWKKDDSVILPALIQCTEKLGRSFFQTYLITSLNKLH